MSAWRGTAPLAVLPVVVLAFVPSDWPRFALMWLVAIAIYAGCKWLTWRRTPIEGAPWWRHVAYLLAWPGMDAGAFLQSRAGRRAPPGPWEWAFAAFKLAIGALLFWGLARFIPAGQPLLAGWIGMAGLIFMLHFGLFHLLSCGWRSLGIDARPLMDWPILSESVAEYWGRRWNRAFRDLTFRFLFRPLSARLDPRWALATGFLASGLIHDLVMSVPAGGGYGLPTAYFAIQAIGLLIERTRTAAALGLGRGMAGRLFAALIVAAPAWLLFHPPFTKNIVVPFMAALGALDSP